MRRAVLQGKRGAGAGLVELLLERLPPECMPRGAVVTWIPAHPRRALTAPDVGAALARALAAREGLVVRRLLRRQPWARRQAGADRDTRRAQGDRLGLRVRTAWPASVPSAVVLVDDVRTTGATLDHAADLLHEAGARHVIGVTAALAGAT
ncbi:MAG: phosphoribosyltransferase family protein [Patulibacter minatonensis]